MRELDLDEKGYQEYVHLMERGHSEEDAYYVASVHMEDRFRWGDDE
jgi:hypothetical protein